jgi:hypothetical protein
MIADWIIYLVVFFVASDLVLVAWLLYRRQRRQITPALRAELARHWQELISHGVTTKTILELDKLLDLALQYRGMSGSLGEKLKAANALFSNPQAVWESHKLRNRLAHELNAEVGDRELQSAVSGFRGGLRDLGIEI